MYDGFQVIRTPFGVSVFGSALLRVTPDVACLRFSVSRVENKPKDAFDSARKATSAVRQFLKESEISEVGSSRLTLEQNFKYTEGEHQFVGYVAEVGFHVVLRELDRVEEILIGVVDAGVNVVHSVSFQTSGLKNFRAQARRLAVEAAGEKAQVYCTAAGVRLGRVVHIEDINPDVLTGRYDGHVRVQIEPDTEGDIRAFDPGAITVAGAVRVGYSIIPDSDSYGKLLGGAPEDQPGK